MSCKEFRDAVDNSRRVDAKYMLVSGTCEKPRVYVRLAFEVFHDIQEAVVDVRLVVKLYFDLVKVGQGILEDQAR